MKKAGNTYLPTSEHMELKTVFATTYTNTYIPICNLSTTHKHYSNCTHLCLTVLYTFEAICNRQTAYNL